MDIKPELFVCRWITDSKMYDVRKIIGRDSLHKLEKLNIQPKIGEYSLARIETVSVPVPMEES